MELETSKTTVAVNSPPVLKYKKTSMSKIFWERFSRNKLAVIGLVIIVTIILLALLAPVIAPYDPAKQNLLHRLKPPSAIHFLGTDDLGRDIFSRILWGARVSLTVGFVAVLGSITIGTFIGAIAGYYGGKLDSFLMRAVDVIISFPSIFLLITVVSILKPSLMNIILVFIAFGWTGTSRLVRGEFLTLKNREYVLAAQTVGMSDARIIFRHILPNAMASIIVTATLAVGGTILAESTLSFLGLGIQPPTASWGNMLQGAQNITIMLTAWWYPLFPGLMILITVLAINFIGDGLRDALDPRMN